MTDSVQAELRDRLFELWRDGRSDNDRYNSVNAAEEWLTDWHNKQELEARIDTLEYAKISPKFKIEERIEKLKQELEKL